MRATVVGNGVIGLTTATVFQQMGYTVHIVARDNWKQTTSANVGAIWFPYSAAPVDKVNHWSAVSYNRYQSLSVKPETGVIMAELLVLADENSDDSWTKELPQYAVRKANQNELPRGYERGFVATVPVIPPPAYLKYLESNFLARGGSLEQREIKTMGELAAFQSPVINCTGLGAREICNDTSMFAIRGQLLKARPFAGNCMVNATKTGELSYIIHRKDASIIGGTDEVNNESLEVDPRASSEILARLERLGYLPDKVEIMETVVGLRPKRTEIRCEQDAHFPNVFHNYGHGGAGFTTAWGCAEEIAAMVTQQINDLKNEIR